MNDVQQSIENVYYQAAQSAMFAEIARQQPSVLFRPRVFPDGDQWCALYGDDIASGVAAFGDTPQAAMTAFDAAWRTRRTHPGRRGGDESRQVEGATT